MDYTLLEKEAESAIAAFNTQTLFDKNDDRVISIINQMNFIRDCAKNSKNPRNELKNGQTFTYGVIASREFASPEEMKLKKYLDAVTNALYPEDF